MKIKQFAPSTLLVLLTQTPLSSQAHNVIWNWSGAYFGSHCGAALGKFDVSNPYGHSIYGDDIRTPGFIAGIQAGYNWHLENSQVVLGVEAEISGLDAQGTQTAFAYDGTFVSSNVEADPDVIGTISARIGYSLFTSGKLMTYLKAGISLLDNEITATPNHSDLPFLHIMKTTEANTYFGGSLGAGIEFAMSPCSSIRLEYQHQLYNDASITTPQSLHVYPDTSYLLVSSKRAHVQQHMNQLTLGLNYFPNPHCTNRSLTTDTLATGWHLDVGLRYFYSWGRFQKDLPRGTTSSNLVSRLVYDDLQAHSGELFGRIETPYAVFSKVMIGMGRIHKSKMNDEDWLIPVGNNSVTSYQNTLSDTDHTDIHYANADVGYEVINKINQKIGLFIGYSHIKEQYIADGFSYVSPMTTSPLYVGRPGITETDKWNALRLGINASCELNDCWSLNLDLAYLPYVKMSGEDDHWLRGLTLNESSSGRGVQLEVIANYHIQQQFSIGTGLRYWAIWADEGSDKTTFTDSMSKKSNRTDTYRYERFGVFLQGSYEFSDC